MSLKSSFFTVSESQFDCTGYYFRKIVFDFDQYEENRDSLLRWIQDKQHINAFYISLFQTYTENQSTKKEDVNHCLAFCVYEKDLDSAIQDLERVTHRKAKRQ